MSTENLSAPATDKTHDPLSTYVVTIGYNGAPFPFYFNEQIRVDVRTVGATIVTEFATVGEWEGETEEGRAFIVQVPTDQVSLLRRYLRGTAIAFGQDAIGFIGGPSTDTLVHGCADDSPASGF